MSCEQKTLCIMTVQGSMSPRSAGLRSHRGVSHISISDHSHVYAFRKLSVRMPTKGHTTVSYREFKNFDSAKFRNDISQQNWDSLYSLI
jgi:hypothetical protein